MSRPLVATAAVVVVALGLPPAPARGNNAFPDTGQVLLPADRPKTIVLGTNFGLIISEDEGATWRWTCEHDEGLNSTNYELTPGSPRLLSVGNGLAWSDDLACTWQTPQPPDPFAFDVFPDPGTPNRYLVAVDRVAGSTAISVVVETVDGARTLGRTVFTAPAGWEINTLEVARSDPRVVYLTLYSLMGAAPNRVARTTDGGQTWDLITPMAGLGNSDLYIAAIDPVDPRKLYFRAITGNEQERLALSEDGGDTASTPLVPDGKLTAFARLPDGAVLVGALKGADGRLYRSTDGGHSFTLVSMAIHPRGLAERGGKLYAATDDVLDGHALEVSTDRGDSWQPVMSFKDIGSISSCGPLPGACANPCALLTGVGLVRPELCAGLRPDGGADAGGGGGGGGCSCRVGAARRPGGWVVLWGLALLLWRRRR
jgi:MYXO-CTERM domain-containing protein